MIEVKVPRYNGGPTLLINEAEPGVVKLPGKRSTVLLNRNKPELGHGKQIIAIFSWHLVVLVESPGRLPEHELQLAQSAPPDARVPRLQLGLPLVEEVDQVGGDWQ